MPVPNYPAIELGQPGKTACPDNFSAASTRQCPGCSKLIIQTSLAGVFVQFGLGGGGVEWGGEEPYMPTVGTLVRRFDAVRVRNLIAGQAAQVLLTPIAG